MVANVCVPDATKMDSASDRSADEKNASESDDHAKTSEKKSGERRRAPRRRSQLREADGESGDKRRQADDGEQQSEHHAKRAFRAGVHFNSPGTTSTASETRTNREQPERRHLIDPPVGRR